jgi:hypothetical protein
MAIPSYLNHVPSMLRETTYSITHFIVDAQEGLVRTKFIKYTLKDISNYLEKYIIQLEAALRKNDTLGKDKEYIRISDTEPKKSNGNGDKVLKSIINRAKEKINE